MKLADIYRHAVERPGHLAVVNNGVEVSYRRFAGMIEAVRRHLAAQALPECGVAAVMAGPLVESWVLQLAVRSLGLTAVSVPSWETLDGLRLRDLAAIVAFDRTWSSWDHDPAERRGCAGIRVPSRLLAEADTIALPDVPDEALAGDLIVFTSATTGTYKKLCYYSEAFAGRQQYYRAVGIGFDPDAVVHTTSFGAWTAAGALMPQRAWTVGATIVFDQRKEWVDHLFDYPVSSIFLIDYAMSAVYRSELQQPPGYPPLEIQMGGGFITAAFLEQLRQRFNCRPMIMYGGTEFAPALLSKVEHVDDLLWLTPTAGEMLEIVDDDDRPVPDEVAGNVRLRLHDWEPPGYLDEPEATADFYRDGYFYPGDMAMRRGDGRVRILGRTKDVLVIAGTKVAVHPHERRAQDILGVDSVCLFSRQAENGDTVLLVVVEGENLPPRERLQAMATYYASSFTEAKFACLPSFPRGANGMAKINRQALLQLVEV